jgi:hypothetical protein
LKKKTPTAEEEEEAKQAGPQYMMLANKCSYHIVRRLVTVKLRIQTRQERGGRNMTKNKKTNRY